MNGMVTVSTETERDIRTVTTEIRTLVHAAQRLVLEYAIDIGRRLCEAKAMLPHGEWGTWLKEEVDFSQSSANNFMRIFEEYGAEQLTIDGAVANSQTLGNLSYSKALRLLAVPAEERDQFAQEHDVEHMSTRELDRVIRERDEALRRAEVAETTAAEYREKADNAVELQEKLRAAEEAEASAKTAQAEAEKQLDELRAAAEKAKEKEKAARQKLKELRDNPDIPQDVLDKIKAEAETAAEYNLRSESERLQAEADRAAEERREAEARAEELRRKLAAASPEMTSFKILFSSVQEDFDRLYNLLTKIEENDASQGAKLRAALRAMLAQCEARIKG